MEIVTFVPATAANPYTEDIAALLAATELNPNAAGVFTVNNKDAIKSKKLIADAANAVGKTASFGKRTVVESTETRYVVMLTHKHAARRNAEREKAAKSMDAIAADIVADPENAVVAITEAPAKATPKPRATRK
jgi:hypothetical protein